MKLHQLLLPVSLLTGTLAFALINPNFTPVHLTRGFRVFGFAEQLDVTRALPAAGNGVQAGALADTNNDGALDLILKLSDGALWLLPRNTTEAPALAALITTPKDPVTSKATFGTRSLGAHLVTTNAPAFIGISEPGPLRLQWQRPGQPAQQKDLLVESAVLRFTVPE